MKVKQAARGNIGVRLPKEGTYDCIYTAGGKAGPSQRSVSTKLADHVDIHDSFVIGPYGK